MTKTAPFYSELLEPLCQSCFFGTMHIEDLAYIKVTHDLGHCSKCGRPKFGLVEGFVLAGAKIVDKVPENCIKVDVDMNYISSKSDAVREVVSEIITWAVSAGMGIDQAGELMKKLYSVEE
mgnify:CR=1 FL=1